MENKLSNEQKYTHEQIDALEVIEKLRALQAATIETIEFCEKKKMDHVYHDGMADALDIAIGLLMQKYDLEYYEYF